MAVRIWCCLGREGTCVFYQVREVDILRKKKTGFGGVFGTRGFTCPKPRLPVGGDGLERTGLGERKALALREARIGDGDGASTS